MAQVKNRYQFACGQFARGRIASTMNTPEGRLMKPAKIAEVVVLIAFGMLIMALIQANQARSQALFPCPTLPEVPVRIVTATDSLGQAALLGGVAPTGEVTLTGEVTPTGPPAQPVEAAQPGEVTPTGQPAQPVGAAPAGEATQPSVAAPGRDALQPAVASTSELTLTRGAVTVWPAITLPPSSTPEPTITSTPPAATLRPLSTGPGITRVEPLVEAQTGQSAVNVRVLPGTNAGILVTLQPGTPLTIFERTQVGGQSWAHVTLSQGGQIVEGWIFEPLLIVPNSNAS
jgi:hypothetical protein